MNYYKWLLLFICCVCLACGQPRDQSSELTVYTSRHYAADDSLYAEFQRETGTTIRVVKNKDDTLINRLLTEGAQADADVLITADAARLHRAKNLGLLQPIKSKKLDQLVGESLRDPEHHWYALTLRARIIVHRKDFDTGALRNYLLLTRRSLVASKLTEPGPNREELDLILRCATRVPDHGKLTPWRIKVVQGQARRALGQVWRDIFERSHPDASAEQLNFECNRPYRAPLMLIVSTKIENQRIPAWEQILSGGAVCQNVLIAATSLGYHAQWLSEWPNYDTEVKEATRLSVGDYFLGFIYIGTASEVPVERVRPQIEDIVSWYDEGETAHGTTPA